VYFQVLVVASQSCDISAQQHAFNRFSSVPIVPLHSHLRSARHAAFRRRVSFRVRSRIRCAVVRWREPDTTELTQPDPTQN